MPYIVVTMLRNRRLLLFAALTLVVSGALPGAAKPAPVPADGVVITRFFQKHNWKVFEACQVVGMVEGGKEVPVKREKRNDVFVSRVKAGERDLVLEVMTSTDSIFKSMGGVRFPLRTRLQAGTPYEVKLLREGDRVEIWICETGSGNAVSERVAFEIEHPTIKIIVIPLPIG